MGTRGPLPKPPELKALEGGRGHRPLELDKMFRPEVGQPDAPRWLLAEGKKAWRRLTPELLRYNLLSKVDRDSFALMCQTIGRLEQIERSIGARQALLVTQGKDPTDALMDVTPNGLRIQSAIYQILNKEQAKLHRLLETFGLRPDARARVTAGIRAQLQLFEAAPGSTGDGKPAAEASGFADFN